MDHAERIYREIISEEASHWFISDKFGKKILFKLSTPTIKSIMCGCKVQLFFTIDSYKSETYMLVGVRIFDDTINYLDLTGIQRHQFEHDALESILKENDIFVEFYNELNICSANAIMKLQTDQKRKIQELIKNQRFYVGDFTPDTSSALDRLDAKLHSKNEKNIDFVDCSIFEFKHINSYIYGENEVGSYNLTAEDGNAFENLAWASAQGVFRSNIYKNPLVIKNEKDRELTDIFAFHKYGYFVVETKALAVMNNTQNKGMDRKNKGVKKQIAKAIKQISGAISSIRKGYTITDNLKNEIYFQRDHVPHGLILISEFYPIGDWDDIKFAIFNAMAKEKMFLNLLDLREFTKLTLPFKDKPELFDYNLMERAKASMENNTIFIKGKLK